MLMWLPVIILAYLFFGLASLCDKLVLAGKPKPNSYTFYVGVFGLFVILLIPFVKLSFPDSEGLTWIILDAIVHLAGLYTMYVALEKFDHFFKYLQYLVGGGRFRRAVCFSPVEFRGEELLAFTPFAGTFKRGLLGKIYNLGFGFLGDGRGFSLLFRAYA